MNPSSIKHDSSYFTFREVFSIHRVDPWKKTAAKIALWTLGIGFVLTAGYCAYQKNSITQTCTVDLKASTQNFLVSQEICPLNNSFSFQNTQSLQNLQSSQETCLRSYSSSLKSFQIAQETCPLNSSYSLQNEQSFESKARQQDIKALIVSYLPKKEYLYSALAFCTYKLIESLHEYHRLRQEISVLEPLMRM